MNTQKTESKPDLIIAGRSDGFGARIGNLLIAKRVSNQTNIPIEVLWVQLTKRHGYNGDIQDILAADSLNSFHFLKTRGELREHIVGKREHYNCLRLSQCTPVYKDDAERDQARDELMNAFQSLAFTPKIEAAMRHIDEWAQRERKTSASLLGIHMRLGDVCNDVERWFNNKYLPKDIYILFIDKLAQTTQDACFYLASNDPQARSELKARFGKIIGLNDILDTAAYNVVELDFLEIYCLSRCELIYGPKLSAFSQCASMISGVKVESIGEYTLGPEVIGIIHQLLKDCAQQVKAQTLAQNQAQAEIQAEQDEATQAKATKRVVRRRARAASATSPD